MKKSKGFTLVELMVVIVIIGILAALAIPRFMGATNKSKATEFKPVLKQIYTLQTAYKQEKDKYGTDAASIGFDNPPGVARFKYSVPAGADAITVDSGAANALGEAALIKAGSIKSVNGNDIAAGAKACVDGQSIQYAVDSLAALANVKSSSACPSL